MRKKNKSKKRTISELEYCIFRWCVCGVFCGGIEKPMYLCRTYEEAEETIEMYRNTSPVIMVIRETSGFQYKDLILE